MLFAALSCLLLGIGTPSFGADTAWFKEAKFGLFIHWSPSSMWGTEIMDPRRSMPRKEFETAAMRFDPRDFNAKSWVRLAKQAGMRYIVFTAKHHDGFCMFDSALTDFKITKTPSRRDVLAELARACREEGMPLGIYYSLIDWHHPDFLGKDAPPGAWAPKARPALWPRYARYVREQVRELSTKYGEVAVFWFDGGRLSFTLEDWGYPEIFAMIRRLQPKALINDRTLLPGDFSTWEQLIPEPGQPQGPAPHELCLTIGTTWGYSRTDRNFKSAEFLISRLAKAAGRGANLLLNVGPMPSGRIQPEFEERLLAVGDWLKANGEAVYGTSAGPLGYAPQSDVQYVSTAKDGVVYLHLLRVPKSWWLRVRAPGLRVRRARLLEGGAAVTFWQLGENLLLRLPRPGSMVIELLLRAP
ncbi:MAG: alpha-L-fucosidase [Elusimicrobia bacterium]|nr:alpha-L-fucosidase [Elusimicrobiota bacterium]